MSQAIQVQPVILCGGSGTRLWPLSRAGFPKQFLVLSGTTSLFQQAIEHVNNLSANDIAVGSTLVVTNEEHRFLALDQLRELPYIEASMLLEPVGRNTAPALTIAALEAMSAGEDPVLVVTPADQTVQDAEQFRLSLQQAIRVAATGSIVILGITPNRPETGYGYIRREGVVGSFGEYTVREFVEKPNLETAEQYLADGHYFWNGGMFVLRASVWLKALKQFRSDIAEISEQAWGQKKSDAPFVRPNRKLFANIPSESIDYAVMEKCPGSDISIKMVNLDAGWNDLGAWDAVWQVGDADQNGNVTNGDILLADTTNTYIHASTRLVSAVGLDNLVIVETADAVLVADKNQSQHVKKIVTQLEQQKREEKDLHRKVSRPWGWYDSIDQGERFKVKRIMVKPGASLSLQMHHHRAEHWIVVKGTAEITNGEQIILLAENQSTYIPQGQIHRLRNPGLVPLEIIEVQSGSYLGEDDIVRLNDSYGRV
jgi:mannose-1-phosphate guanylyltransferase / mannose-6-phosphate isomerase